MNLLYKKDNKIAHKLSYTGVFICIPNKPPQRGLTNVGLLQKGAFLSHKMQRYIKAQYVNSHLLKA